MKDVDQELNKRSAKLRDEWKDLSEGSRLRAAKANDELQKQQNALAEWYGALKNGSPKTWNDVKKGFE